jgi:putative NADPH-quinone reductase
MFCTHPWRTIVPKQVLIIDGHPDPSRERFCHALADAYAHAAAAAGHAVRRIVVGEMDVPVLRSAAEWSKGAITPELRQCQLAIDWADHLVVIYPLWLGTMPAMLKALLEQVLRPGFAIKEAEAGGWPGGRLKGKSARIIVTMGMPAFVYRWYFFAHSLRSLERNILAFVGIGPIRDTLIGGVDSLGVGGRERWLASVRALGEAAR